MPFMSRFTPAAAGLVLVAGSITVWAGPTSADTGAQGPGGGQGSTLYVSNTSGPNSGADSDAAWSGQSAPGQSWPGQSWSGQGHENGPSARGCANAPYATIGSAVAAASAGNTIVVCPGVYGEDVVVPAGKPLTIEGIGGPIVNAAGKDNGFQVLASWTTIEGFTVGYATGEGILVGALPGQGGTVTNVTVKDNRVIANDRGNPTGQGLTDFPYAECNGTVQIPGDCGEGIHLLSADNSVVEGNFITGNSGGILLTDENGPTDGNLIAANDSVSNAYDCGITLAGHVGTNTGQPVAPSVAGVYNNTVRGNWSDDNGVLGQGGGILMATGAPGGAVYDNLVEGNFVSGDGLSGVTVHSHAPGQDLNGNAIRDNVIGTNNLDGDFDFSAPPTNAADPLTTGVLVATSFNPVSITIVGNHISYDHFGIWMTPNVTAVTSPPPNTFVGVTVPIFTAP